MDDRFDKYKNGELSDSEFREFRDDVNRMSDEDLSAYLDTMHADFDFTDDDTARLAAQLNEDVVREKRRLRRMKWLAWTSAAAACAIVVAGGLWISDIKRNSVPRELISKMTAISTRNGEKATVILPDGSTVKLGPASQLQYEIGDFAENNRQIQYMGCGDFKISADKAHPFTINSNDLKVTVTGTEFTVINRPGSDLCEVQLTRGEVAVKYGDDGRSVTINPNETVVINKSNGRIEVVESSEHNLRESEAGLIYTSAPLSRIAADLRTYYNVEVSIAPEYRSVTFTGLVPVNDLDLALYTLNQTVGAGAVMLRR